MRRPPLVVMLLVAAALFLAACGSRDGTDERPLDANEIDTGADLTLSVPTEVDPATTLATPTMPSTTTTVLEPAAEPVVDDDTAGTAPDISTTSAATTTTTPPTSTTTTVLEPTEDLVADNVVGATHRILGATYVGPKLFCNEWWSSVSWRADAPPEATITITEPAPDSTMRTRTGLATRTDGVWVFAPAETESEVTLSLVYEGAVHDETTLSIPRPGTETRDVVLTGAPFSRFCSVTQGPPVWNPPLQQFLVDGFWDVLVSWEAVGQAGVEVTIYGPVGDFPYRGRGYDDGTQGHLDAGLGIVVPGDRDSEILVVLEFRGIARDRRVLAVERPS